MTDDTTDSSILTDLRKDRHREWKDENTDVIRSSHITHRSTNNGETLVFRELGKPKVDFYPSTGRWRVVSGQGRTMGGHAMKFLEWYAEQTA
jgi:uncharacterized membrane protein